jgi:tRNA G18 (ribose-2'-O)-methylase SpoU
MDTWTPNSTDKYAIILGNEVKGVQQHILDTCDFSVEIPQYGIKRSLNVSVAAALTIHHIFSNTQFVYDGL